MTSEVYAIIPARAGSKGVPDKNIRSLAGLPLLAYSVKTALNATAIDRVFVSTDSPVYRDIATSHGAEAPFLRPEDIAGDKSSDLDVMQHFLNWLNDNGEPAPKYLVHLRPTTPLRSPAMVDQAIGMIDKHPEATALRSVHEMAETAYKCVEREGEFLVSAFTRNTELDAINSPRQGFPATYVANGYVDILRPELISGSARIHGDRVLGFVTPPVTEVDCEDDFAYLEFELHRTSVNSAATQEIPE